MNVGEANKIIAGYEASLAKGTVGETVLREISLLPHSKAKIKYAYFVVLENLVKENGLSSALRAKMVEEYSQLNYFIDDIQAQKYAKTYENWQARKDSVHKTKQDEMQVKQYIAYTHMLKMGISEEINGYIKELLGV